MKFFEIDCQIDHGSNEFPVLGENFDKLGGNTVLGQLKPLILSKGANLNDILSGEIPFKRMGLYANEKMKTLITSLNAPHIESTPIDLVDHKSQPISGYYFLELKIADNLVDFEQSKFYIKDFMENLGEVEISSNEELIKKDYELSIEGLEVEPEELVLNDFYASKEYDIFYVKNVVSFNIIITDKVRDLFLENGVTGVDFKPLDNLRVLDV